MNKAYMYEFLQMRTPPDTHACLHAFVNMCVCACVYRKCISPCVQFLLCALYQTRSKIRGAPSQVSNPPHTPSCASPLHPFPRHPSTWHMLLFTGKFKYFSRLLASHMKDHLRHRDLKAYVLCPFSFHCLSARIWGSDVLSPEGKLRLCYTIATTHSPTDSDSVRLLDSFKPHD